MSSQRNTISVVIPTYNRAELVCEAVKSVLAQTHPVSEIVVVDDGSTDTTGQALAGFGNRIRTIRTAQNGISAARNTGMDACGGEFIAFLDNDDLWVPEKIEKQLAFTLGHSEMALTYTDAVQFSTSGVETTSFADRFSALNDAANLFTPMILECAVPLMSTVMMRHSFLKQSGLRFQDFAGIDDVGLFLEMMMAGARFGYLPERLTMRRMHGGNFSGNHRRRFEQRKLLYSALLRQWEGRCTPAQRALLGAGLKDAGYRVGECSWGELDLKGARREFFQAVSLDGRGVKAASYGLLSFLPAGLIRGARRIKQRREAGARC